MENETGIPAASPLAHPSRFPLSRAALLLAVAVAIAGVMAGFGSRWGLWNFRTGFTILRWAAYGGIASAIVSAAALYRTRPGTRRRGFSLALVALIVSLLTFVVPWQSRRMGAGAPPIHDITTDTRNPPAFVAVAPLRANEPNPVEYAGEEAAGLQREAYPDIRPLILDLPLEQAFQQALAAAQAQGWEIVDANPSDGRIEATDRTFWFGFRDDVVIRLTPLEGRTVVDVRSKSRVGRGDLGTNARRVREYLEALSS